MIIGVRTDVLNVTLCLNQATNINEGTIKKEEKKPSIDLLMFIHSGKNGLQHDQMNIQCQIVI